MRRVPTYLLVVFLGWSGVSAVHAQQIKVMQWNIRGHLGNASSNNTAEAKALGRIVSYNRPDILLFNEVQRQTVLVNSAALSDWVTNNVPYLGSNGTFSVTVSSATDTFIRNAAISRYPISDETTYSDGLRGLHRFRVQLAGTNVLEIFHAHLKADNTGSDCTDRQGEATQDASNIVDWATANSIPYIMAGDWNEDETNPQCTTNSSYHPITTLREGAHLVEFKPSALNGDSDTIGTPNPNRRFDYCLAGSNRLSAVSGYVFNSTVWATNTVQSGLYTNEVTGSSPCDSTTASDHCAVFVVYSFPTEPPDFTVSPTNAFASSGNQGGSFTPASQVYTLSNTNATSLDWAVSNREAWVSLSATNGTLAASDSTNITVSINSKANGLVPHSYVDFVTFSDTNSGGSLTREVDLSVVNTNGFFDDFSTFTSGNLVGQQSWTLFDTSNSLPLQVNGGQVVIPYGQLADNQDAYKNFPATVAPTFWGMVLTVSNAPSSSSPSTFLAMTSDINGGGSIRYRLSAKNNGSGTYVLGGRVAGTVLAPLTFGSTGLATGTPYRAIIEGDNGINVMKVFINPTSTNLAAQTPYLVDNNGDCSVVQVGSLLISQFGSASLPNVGLSMGKLVVATSFADAYNFLSPTLTVAPLAGFDASGNQGGSFTPDTEIYTLGNAGSSPLSWTASVSSNWLDVSATSGTLSGGASTNITVTINANANALVGGLYSNLVSFVNATDGIGTTNVVFSLLVRDGISDDWRQLYFGHVDPRASDLSRAQDDPDGDGCNNLCEFQAGTDPNNSTSYFHITSVKVQGIDVLLTWATGLGRTNVVQATAGLPNGSYATNFSNVGSPVILPNGSGPTTTNFTDTGAVTNSPARYYRIRLQP